MKLCVPDGFAAAIRDAVGAEYSATNGVVDIPDGLVHDGLYGLGFTCYSEPVAPVFQERNKFSSEA